MPENTSFVLTPYLIVRSSGIMQFSIFFKLQLCIITTTWTAADESDPEHSYLFAGIGKSLFSFYVMWLLAKQAQTVVWERRHAAYARVLLSPQGVFSGNVDSFNDELQKSLTW